MTAQNSAELGALADKRLTILGVGIMGSAFARGLVHSGALAPSRLTLFDTHVAKAKSVAAELGGEVIVAETAQDAAEGADVLLIATKPTIVLELVSSVAHLVSLSQLVISIAAGTRISKIEALLGGDVPVIRCMPNTPATVLEGATAMARGTHANAEHMALAMQLFEAVGKAVEVDEKAARRCHRAFRQRPCVCLHVD